MIRTQIQLEENQLRRLRELAYREGISVSEAIRRAVECMLKDESQEWKGRKERALRAVGRFASGLQDVSRSHDRYLEEAFDSR
ncbi:MULTISPECIES: CopG family transcriptional regulator [unclassified Meiothermus]|uniref:ribbon-helix-helix domain-containing protein n=1 Tax=unclassified Meiothermus TaxID=370471 RepID=UPI000D7C1E4F|nr:MULTISPECIES: CopG family transcriptional regulator [unclassified Meiothermus]PZA07010.1 CopG family transcriptional regulator [Meiothermus sp. Pnk-1]RYM35288.1 ribbon-helix-helix protein, CopG family [Meiothermus sp. PNK-Is4]